MLLSEIDYGLTFHVEVGDLIYWDDDMGLVIKVGYMNDKGQSMMTVKWEDGTFINTTIDGWSPQWKLQKGKRR